MTQQTTQSIQEIENTLKQLRIPRYTSYPPATEFGPLTADIQQNWLSELAKDKPVSLYIHVPYCDQLCWFCGCFTTITHKYEPIKKYLDLLLQEIEWIHSITGTLKISHLHMGGGSPTALSADDFSQLLTLIHKKYTFLPNAEIAVEIDPRTVDDKKIKAYADCSVTRASLGVQDFSEDVQKAVNRLQPYALVAKVTHQLRARGINDINLDLMYGLPLQTLDSVIETAKQALTLDPARLAVFGYAHVPWMKKHQSVLDKLPMANPEQRLQMFHGMKQVFVENGFEPIGIDHFAKQNDELTQALRNRTLKRNFQGYTNDAADTLIGFGLSSISSLPQGYAQNPTDIKQYKQLLQNKQSLSVRGKAISADDIMRREIISELMCFYEVDLQAIAKKHALPNSFKKEIKALVPLLDVGLVSHDSGWLKASDTGRTYIRAICSVFDQYLKAGNSRFSLAV